MKPERVYGVDFSGAEDAGTKIWIAGGKNTGSALDFETCQPVSTLPNSSTRRDQALAALRTFITQRAPCVIGLDFPFGLPQALVEDQPWEDFARNFGTNFPNPDSMKAVCTYRAIEKKGARELRRATDVAAGTPFSPYNMRLFRQTYYGIRDVLAPLLSSGVARVLPMQSGIEASIWLIEICPASTLKHLGLSRPYKDAKGRDYRTARQALLSEITQPLGIQVPDAIMGKVRDDRDGDALDSIIAATTTFRALRDEIDKDTVGGPSLVEGYVYK